MDYLEVRARTIDLAVEAAMTELGVTDREQLAIEVLQEPEKGFLGMGVKTQWFGSPNARPVVVATSDVVTPGRPGRRIGADKRLRNRVTMWRTDRRAIPTARVAT